MGLAEDIAGLTTDLNKIGSGAISLVKSIDATLAAPNSSIIGASPTPLFTVGTTVSLDQKTKYLLYAALAFFGYEIFLKDKTPVKKIEKVA